jgi:NitT/TauT family transport system substrate-binding protein
MRSKGTVWWALVVAAVLTLLVGCGDDDGDTATDEGDAASSETTAGDAGDESGSEPLDVELRLGSLKIANSAPQVIDPSLFEDRGITLDVEYATSGAAIVPGVVGGSYDIGYGSVVSVVQSIAQGLPIRIIANGDISVGELVVLADSGIEDAADLEGKTIATNAVKSTVDLETMVLVADRGGDPSTLEFVEVPFPAQLAALDSGTVDAVVLPEPFLSQAKADPKYKSLFSIFDVEPQDLTNCYFASVSFLEENPEAAEQFAEAISEANLLASGDEEAARAAVAAVTGAPPEAVAGIQLPNWLGGPTDAEAVSVTVDRMAEHELVEDAPSVDEIVWQADR